MLKLQWVLFQIIIQVLEKEVLIQIDIVLLRISNSFQSYFLIKKHQLMKFRDGFNGNGIIEILINGQAWFK